MKTLNDKNLKTLVENNMDMKEGIECLSVKEHTISYSIENKHHLATALVGTIRDNSKLHYPMVMYFGKNKYYVDCGYEANNSEEVLNQALRFLPENNKNYVKELINESVLKITAPDCTNQRLKHNLNKLVENDELELQNSHVVCDHIKALFANLPFDYVRKLEVNHRNLFKKISNSENLISEVLDKYGFKGESALVVGPGGGGKTHTIKDFALLNNYEFVELQAHPQIESIDMFGYERKSGDNFIWMDGKVSQAARLASEGKKTVLFIDEFTNLPMSESAGLKASFEPYKGFYYFQTGRVVDITNGIGTIETIKVPVENLQIICAANIGNGYASDELDKALVQRFIVIYYNASKEKIKKVLTDICEEKNFNSSLVNRLMRFQDLIKEEVEKGELPSEASLRHLSRKILGLMKNEDELEEVALLQINQFVEFNSDGKPIEEQVGIVEDIIENTLVEDINETVAVA